METRSGVAKGTGAISKATAAKKDTKNRQVAEHVLNEII